MKNFMKLCKLYFKTTFSPWWAVVGIFGMLFCLAFIFVMGVVYKSEGRIFTGMLYPIFMVHISVILLFSRYEKITQNKFFLSMKNAKQFYTVIPMAVVGTIFLIFDIICFVFSLCLFGGEFTGDLLLILSGNTILAILSLVTDLPKVFFVSVISGICLFLFNPVVIIYAMGYEYGLGLPLATDILISLGIYIVGGALIVGIMTLWWHKSGRVLKFKNEKKKIFY